jgi:hypothetical protein
MKRSNPLFGVINVAAFIVLAVLIVLTSGSFAIVPVATIGCGAFGWMVQRDDEKIAFDVVAGFAIIGLVVSLLWHFFGV